jgi:hypothetical protein
MHVYIWNCVDRCMIIFIELFLPEKGVTKMVNGHFSNNPFLTLLEDKCSMDNTIYHIHIF